MTHQPENPATLQTVLTPEEWQTLAAIKAQLALVRIVVFLILAYGVYDFCKAPNPLGPIIFGVAAFFAHCMRPAMPEELRRKITRPG